MQNLREEIAVATQHDFFESVGATHPSGDYLRVCAFSQPRVDNDFGSQRFGQGTNRFDAPDCWATSYLDRRRNWGRTDLFGLEVAGLRKWPIVVGLLPPSARQRMSVADEVYQHRH